ncbi:MAG: hypothetical protein ACKO7B_02090, partial [Flavobacteriales bacterium]
MTSETEFYLCFAKKHEETDQGERYMPKTTEKAGEIFLSLQPDTENAKNALFGAVQHVFALLRSARLLCRRVRQG